LTAAQLLKEFFDFYADTKNTKSFVISIANSKGTPFIKKNDYEVILNEKSEAMADGDEFKRKFVYNMYNEWAFTIVDPFDFSYNPAKHVKILSTEHMSYLK